MIAQLAAGAVLTAVAAYAIPLWLARHVELAWRARRALRASVRVIAGVPVRSPRPVAGSPPAVARRVVAGEIEGERIEQ